MASRPRRPAVDVYLFPAIVGGGLGDLALAYDAGRALRRAGLPPVVLRLPGRPWPRGTPGPFDWSPIVRHPLRTADRALTVSSQFGVTCAPYRDEPFGSAGPWAEEVESLERTYGAAHVLHLSLEEFARTLGARAQQADRLREGGVPRNGNPELRRVSIAEARRLYRKYRMFDRPNLLTLFASFCPDPAFGREFPEAIQMGPVRPPVRPLSVRPSSRRRTLLWYASSPGSEALLEQAAAGLRHREGPTELRLRSARPTNVASIGAVTIRRWEASVPRRWADAWRGADVVVTTGSRSLLEAIGRGVPFLYWNGTLGGGRHRRRHRPEKIRSLLAMGAASGLSAAMRRDLDRFSRGQQVSEIVRRWVARPPRRRSVTWSTGFPESRRFGDRLLVTIARRWAGSAGNDAPAFSTELRREFADEDARLSL